MFTKQFMLSWLLLFSGVSYMNAMESEEMVEDTFAKTNVGSDDFEVVEPAAIETADEMSMGDDSAVIEIEPVHMKKKMTSDEEIVSKAQEPMEDSIAMEGLKTEEMEDSQPVAMEDATNNQGKADVQGVFESMSREEEDDSFPG